LDDLFPKGMCCIRARHPIRSFAVRSLFDCDGRDFAAASTDQFVQYYENCNYHESSEIRCENNCTDHASACTWHVPHIVVFFLALFRSLFYFTYRTSKNIYKGSNTFKKWSWFQDKLVDYYKVHKHFIGEHCNNYDHPIPWGWEGQTYGVPVKLILRWQWNFIVCSFLVLYSIPICFVGSSIICIVRIPPCICYTLIKMIKEYCKQDCVVMMGTWPFFVAGILIAPPGAVVILAVTVVVITIVMPFILPPRRFLFNGYLSGLFGPFALLSLIDELTDGFMNFSGWRVFPFLEKNVKWCPHRNVPEENVMPIDCKTADEYWDRFVSQCIKTTSDLIESKWITTEDVQTMDPAVIISIPAIAVLEILVESAFEKGLKKEDIKWSIDGSVCTENDRPSKDAIYKTFWPLVYAIKKAILSNKELLADRARSRVIMAMICDNGEDCTNELKEFLDSNKKLRSSTQNILLRTMVTNFVLEISRVRPYLNRMSKIYSHTYEADIVIENIYTHTYETDIEIEEGNCRLSDTSRSIERSEDERNEIKEVTEVPISTVGRDNEESERNEDALSL